MPLVIISGHPASGKTTRARELASLLEKIALKSTNPAHKNLEITIVNDESLGIKRSLYGNPRSEKDARAAFSSAVKRHLSRERIVIADGMNYIKGFRYQMYCEAKAARTPSCCLHVATNATFSHEINAQIEASAPDTSYPVDLLDNLIFRFEEPSSFARWDSPLFTLPTDDLEPPAEEIFEALVGGIAHGGKADAGDASLKQAQPNLATVAPQHTDAGALQRIDQICAGVIKVMQEWAANTGTTSEAQVPIHKSHEAPELCIRMPPGGFTMAGLQRLRREFVGLIRSNPAMGTKEDAGLRAEFVSFVNRRTWEDS